ncbi:hypothetical protein [Mesorhizobium sp. M0030]|uniref:hypothetical protein n=1 Tax=Mesorhizobium sp. M0030 TaxID=2956851 RepID=UPI0033382B98
MLVLERDLIAAAIRSVADEMSIEHFAYTQEHQITSRLGEALQDRFQRLSIFDAWDVSIITQEAPDKGPGTMESATGIDLYVGVSRDGSGEEFDKGFFVQSKKKELARSAQKQEDLVRQCVKMLKLSRHSYVWVYGPDGVGVVRARDVVDQIGRTVEQLPQRNIDELMREVLDCHEGDRRRGISDGPDRRQRLVAQMREWQTEVGIHVEIKRRPRRVAIARPSKPRKL